MQNQLVFGAVEFTKLIRIKYNKFSKDINIFTHIYPLLLWPQREKDTGDIVLIKSVIDSPFISCCVFFG